MTDSADSVVKEVFLSKEFSKLTGLTGYMVTYLCRIELLRPAETSTGARVKGRRRYGKARLFSFSDVLLGRSIRKLLDAGVSVKAIERSIHVLEEKLGTKASDLPKAHITIIDKRIYLAEQSGAPIELTNDGQLAFQYVLEVDALKTAAARVVVNRSETDERRVKRHRRK